MVKKLTRGQKAANTRKANAKIKEVCNTQDQINLGKTLKIKLPSDHIIPAILENVASTMTSLEQAIDALIIRINLQTQRIKDMM